MEPSDGQLLSATLGGEAEAFGEFFSRHRGLVLTFLLRRCDREAAADLKSMSVPRTKARSTVDPGARFRQQHNT